METRRLTAELNLPGGHVRVEMDVPTGEVPMRSLLPALQATADALVSHAAAQSVAAGKQVSCAAGCGACCRQLVPVAHAEARRIAALVEELPEPRRSIVKERFAEALRRVEAAGLLPAIQGRTGWGASRATEVGLEYFRLGIPCPFLEEESCSIYGDRPIACREYLVTSSPVHCAHPTRETIDSVPLPTRVWAALSREETGTPNTGPASCVPLVLAPDWASRHREPETLHPGPETLRSVYLRFAHDRTGEGREK